MTTHQFQNAFETVAATTLAEVTGGKKSKQSKKTPSTPTALGPNMQGALTKNGFQFSVTV